MNVKELKKRASAWDSAMSGSILEAECAREMYNAIMALPDDPQAEHEDLVEMAQFLIDCGGGSEKSLAAPLLRKIIERFGKREPRKVEKWAVMDGEGVACIRSDKKSALDELKRCVQNYPDGFYWLARLTGTEEV